MDQLVRAITRDGAVKAVAVSTKELTERVRNIHKTLPVATAAMAVQVLRLCAVFTAVFWPMSFTLPNALRAAGDARYTMVVSLLSMWICRIGMSYLLGSSWGLGLGLLGVWLAMFADWIVRSAVFLVRFLRGRWKDHQVI